MNLKYTDEDFIKEFIKVTDLLKQGQAAPAPTAPAAPAVDPGMIQAVAKKLVSQLEQSTGITKDPTNTESGELYVKDLQDLNSLIDFLKKEMIQFNGKYIVSKAANTPADPNNPNAPSGPVNPDPKLYVEYSLATGLDAMPMQDKVYVYKDGLVNYLKGLQRQAAQEPNELLGAMVGRLIDSATKQLKISVTPDAKPNETQQFADDTPLDSILDTVIFESPMTPGRNQGNIIITPKILKSKPAFDDFVRKIKLKKKDQTAAYDQFTDDSYCDILYVLWSRANSYNFRRGEPADKYYLDLVVNLSNDYGCNLQEVHSQKGGDGVNQNVAWKPGQPLSPKMKQVLSPIGVRYPLLRDRIDLKWIVEWTTTYQRIMQQVGVVPEQSAQDVLDIANGIMAGYNVTSQSLTSSAVEIYREIRRIAVGKGTSPQQAIHVPMHYVQNLGQLISALVRVLHSYKREFYDSMPEDWQPIFDRQVDDSAGSLAAINTRQINQWIAMMGKAQTQAEQGM